MKRPPPSHTFHWPTLALGSALLLAANTTWAQFDLTFDPSVPLFKNNAQLSMGWAGGLNFPQVSNIDLDGDGDKDLFFFDRTGDRVITLLSNQAQGSSTWSFSRAFDAVPPFRNLREWALLRDFNGDGKEDLFTYVTGGFACWKNTSTGNDLSFAMYDTLIRSNYYPTEANLYVSQVDIPGIEDIDGDGDLDVITFSIFGTYIEYHRNMSMEYYGTADSLEFEIYNRCWGFFSEDVNNNAVFLNDVCDYNVPDPRAAEEIIRRTAEERRAEARDPETQDRAHTGSTNLPIDLDGDGDKDLLVGDIISPTLLGLTNGGDQDSAHMVAQDILFPSYDTPVGLDVFPASFYEDVDHDGTRDLLVTANSETLSEDTAGVWYYHNTGTDASPLFSFQQQDLFQRDMLDLGEGAYPVPFDFDGDGLMDLIVGNYGYFHSSGVYPSMLAALRNTGTATAPAFTLVTRDYMGISTTGMGQGAYPAFGDLDGDGDADMLVGEFSGKLHYFQNDPANGVAQFTLADPSVNSVVNGSTAELDAGILSTPQLFDVDGDGTLDLLVGERNGNVNYYHMLQPAPDQLWELVNDTVGGVLAAEPPFNTGYSTPVMYLNEAGQRELLVGTQSGWIKQYANIDGNLAGAWDLVEAHWQDIDDGEKSGVALHDWDGDGHMDVVVGNYRGGLSYWRNDVITTVGGLDAPVGEDVFTLLPNPTEGPVTVELSMPLHAGMQVTVLDEQGRELWHVPVRARRTPLSTDTLAPGVYMVRLSLGAQRWVQRLAVVR
ncbi:MAG: T9SS type A sorting domain-containing protein [Flavobacteriales bacterium]|nr:T9SS type A sorting domain-containing protein [Flavobacteriales bacterium]